MSHSRPHTSNDNPYSESNFRTLMPERLGSVEHARQVIDKCTDWYNDEHYHVGIALLHPTDVHHRRTADIFAARQRVLDLAHARHPACVVRVRPMQKSPPSAAWINPPPLDQIAVTHADRNSSH